MKRLDDHLRAAAAVAERAAVVRQHAGLAVGGSETAGISALQLVASSLRDAARPLSPPPVASRRAQIEACVTTSAWLLSSTVALLLVPNPAEPWVLATILAGGAALGMPLWAVIAAIWDRRTARALTPARPPEPLDRTIADLRSRISEITSGLAAHRHDSHIEVGRRIELALFWLDEAEFEASRGPRPAVSPFRPDWS